MTETYAVSVGRAVGMPPPRPSGLQTMLFLHQQVGRVNVHGSQMVYTTGMTATVQHTTPTASSAVGEAEQTRRLLFSHLAWVWLCGRVHASIVDCLFCNGLA